MVKVFLGAGENTRKIPLLRNRGEERSLHENRTYQAGKDHRYIVWRERPTNPYPHPQHRFEKAACRLCQTVPQRVPPAKRRKHIQTTYYAPFQKCDIFFWKIFGFDVVFAAETVVYRWSRKGGGVMIEDEKIIELFFARSEQGIRELDIKYGKRKNWF